MAYAYIICPQRGCTGRGITREQYHRMLNAQKFWCPQCGATAKYDDAATEYEHEVYRPSQREMLADIHAEMRAEMYADIAHDVRLEENQLRSEGYNW